MAVKFPKDILMIDFETTNANEVGSEPFQLGAILLDRETLEEKKSFSSFIRADLSKMTPKRKAKKIIDEKLITGAPSIQEVAHQFLDTFGKDYFLASWVQDLDIDMFKKVMSSIDTPLADFDYHVIDVWPIAYTYLLERGYTGPTRSEAIFQEFGLKERGIHDALEDCRHAAEVLRSVLSAK